MINKINIPLHPQELRGDVENNGDIYRQAPSHEVDVAWDRFLYNNSVWIHAEDIIAAGKDPSVAVKLPIELGYGSNAYAAMTDFGHKVHCLNWLRKEIYFDYYWSDSYPTGNTTGLHKSHTDHCIYILLQSLLCEASTDILIVSWYEGLRKPEVDFTSNRKCGDVEGVLEWSEEHALDTQAVDSLKIPHEQKALKASSELLELLSQNDGMAKDF